MEGITSLDLLDKLKEAHANLSHEAYFHMAAPGPPEAKEFFAVDVWMSTDDMKGYFEDPKFLAGYDHMFTAEANTAVWIHPAGDWVEW